MNLKSDEQSHILNEDYAQAIVVLETIIELDPLYATSKLETVKQQLKEQKGVKIYAEFTKSFSNEEWAEAFDKLSIAKENTLVNYALLVAICDFEKQLLPKLYYLGQHHYKNGKWQDALDYFKRVEKIDCNYKKIAKYLNNSNKYKADKMFPFYDVTALSKFGFKAILQLGFAILFFYISIDATIKTDGFGEYSFERKEAGSTVCGGGFIGLILLTFALNNIRKIFYRIFGVMDPFNRDP